MDRKKILIPIIILTAIIILLIITLDPTTRYKKLFTSEDKWNNIISTRTENKNLGLDSIDFNDYNLIIDERSNTLYYSLINDSDNKYNPNVSFSSNDKSAKIAILSDEITDEKVKSDYKFKIMIYNSNEYHIYNLVCTDFPILNISYRQDVGDKHKNIPVKIYLFNNLSNSTNRVTISDGRLKINDDSYTFSLNMTTPGKNIRENKRSIFNMQPNSEYVLNSTNISDVEPKNQRVVLFINSQYKGIYSIEHKNIERKSGEKI